MVKLSLFFLVLVMLLSGPCSSNRMGADAQRLCRRILEQHSCDFYDCTRHCSEEFGSVKAKCIPNPSKPWLHACACYVPC